MPATTSQQTYSYLVRLAVMLKYTSVSVNSDLFWCCLTSIRIALTVEYEVSNPIRF